MNQRNQAQHAEQQGSISQATSDNAGGKLSPTLSRLKHGFLILMSIAISVGVVCIALSVLPDAAAVLNLNQFLFTHYGAFLVMRLGFYGVMAFAVMKIKKRVVGTPYFRSYCRTCGVCGVMVALNEVMLLIRVMEA